MLVLLSGLLSGGPLIAQAPIKFDPLLLQRSSLWTGQSRVVVTAADGVSIAAVGPPRRCRTQR